MIRNCCGQRQRGRPHLNICIIGTPLGRDRENAGVACRRHLLLSFSLIDLKRFLPPSSASSSPYSSPPPEIWISIPFFVGIGLFNNLEGKKGGRTRALDKVKEARTSSGKWNGKGTGRGGGEKYERDRAGFVRNRGRTKRDPFSTKKRQYRRAIVGSAAYFTTGASSEPSKEFISQRLANVHHHKTE